MTSDVSLEHLAGVVFLRSPALTFHSVLYGKKSLTVSSPHLRGGDFVLPSLRMEYLHKLLGILLHGRFVSSPLFIYLFQHLFISVWTNGYLLYILGYNYLTFSQSCSNRPLWHYSHFFMKRAGPSPGLSVTELSQAFTHL